MELLGVSALPAECMDPSAPNDGASRMTVCGDRCRSNGPLARPSNVRESSSRLYFWTMVAVVTALGVHLWLKG